MPFIKVYIHFVWSTKYRKPHLRTLEIRNIMWAHIKENAKKKDIFILAVNGYSEHCHCLVSLGSSQSMEKVTQLIKGESSHWINKAGLINEKFEWQSEYFAASVSNYGLGVVKNYIKNQEEHHKKESFKDEYDDLMEKYGFEKFDDTSDE